MIIEEDKYDGSAKSVKCTDDGANKKEKKNQISHGQMRAQTEKREKLNVTCQISK